MGRVKTQLVKRNSMKLFNGNKERFSNDFTVNKQAVQELVIKPNKKLRNMIAGYITRLVKNSKDL